MSVGQAEGTGGGSGARATGEGGDWLTLAEAVCGAVTVVGVLRFVINVLWSRRSGAIAPANPWGAATLEWTLSSPPPEYNFTVIPAVHWEIKSPFASTMPTA